MLVDESLHELCRQTRPVRGVRKPTFAALGSIVFLEIGSVKDFGDTRRLQLRLKRLDVGSYVRLSRTLRVPFLHQTPCFAFGLWRPIPHLDIRARTFVLAQHDGKISHLPRGISEV